MKRLINKGVILGILVFLLVIAFVGCSLSDGEDTLSDEMGNSTGTFNSNVNTNVTGILDGSILTVTRGTAVVGDIVLVSGNSAPVTAVKVESISNNVATVSEAQVEDVFSALVIDEKAELGAGNIVSNNALASSLAPSRSLIFPNIDITESEDGITFSINDYTLYSNADYGINISAGGSIFLSKPELAVKYDLITGKSSSSVSVSELGTFVFDATMDRTALVDKDIVLATYSYPISVSGITIATVNFVVILNVGVSGEAALHFSFNQGMTTTSKIETLNGITTTSFDVAPPAGEEDFYNYDVTGYANFDAWANLVPEASFSILQFEIAKIRPDIGISANIKGNFSAANDTLESAGFSLIFTAHAKADAIFLSLDNDPINIFDYSYVYEYQVAAQ